VAQDWGRATAIQVSKSEIFCLQVNHHMSANSEIGKAADMEEGQADTTPTPIGLGADHILEGDSGDSQPEREENARKEDLVANTARTLLADPSFRPALRKGLEELARQKGHHSAVRVGRNIHLDQEPEVKPWRRLFIHYTINLDRALLRELHNIWNEYARNYRDELRFQDTGGRPIGPGWGWASVAFGEPDGSGAFRQALASCLGPRNLDIPWIWDCVLYSFELWYGCRQSGLYDPNAEVVVPPTAHLAHLEPEIRISILPGESRRDYGKRLEMVCDEVKSGTRESCDIEEFDAQRIASGIRWLAELVKSKQVRLTQLSHREGLSRRQLKRDIDLAARIIGYPLHKRRAGRPRK
jgi:hypothetical protein